MTQFFQHILQGTLETDDTWMTGLYTYSATLGPNDAHTAWLNAIGELWKPGSVGNAGWSTVVTGGVVATRAATYLLDAARRKRISMFQTALSLTGSAAGDTVAPQVAAFVLLSTLGAPARRDGRMYLPAPWTGGWDKGRLDGTRFALLGTCVSKMLLSLIGAGLHPTVLQVDTRQNNDVTDIRVSQKVSVMRSRGGGVNLYNTIHIFP